MTVYGPLDPKTTLSCSLQTEEEAYKGGFYQGPIMAIRRWCGLVRMFVFKIQLAAGTKCHVCHAGSELYNKFTSTKLRQ